MPSVDDRSPFFSRKASDLMVDRLLAKTVEEELQPRNSRDFKRVLDIFDSRLYNFLLTGRPVKFSSLTEEGKQRYLASWRDSSIGLKRAAFQALKRLTCFLNYTIMDESGVNPNWPDIGYPGPSHDSPVPLPDELRIKPLEIEKDTKLECDVCIVGSGAGGSVIADKLASSGLDVLVLEQGPYETSETFKQSELYMMQKLFLQGGTASTKDLSFVLLAGRGAGGGTTVNWNTCLKPPTKVLKEWESEFGLTGVAGPEFAAYVEDVWRTMRVNDKESQRNPNNQALWDGCRALGYKEGTDYEVIQRNAVGCRERCDYCSYGCIYGCKQSTAVTYLPSAYRNGTHFAFNTRVERVIVEGGRARGVSGLHRSGGRTFALDVKSKAVVVACGAIETPALLLRSGIRDRNIGNYLRLDPTAAVGGAHQKIMAPWAGPPQTVSVWKFIDLDGTYHGFWIEAAPAHPGLFALSIPWVDGRHHKEFMQQYYARSSASIVLVREKSWGRVSVDREGNPVVQYDIGSHNREMIVRGMEETAKILAAAGAVYVWTTHNSQILVGDGTRPVSQAALDDFSERVRRAGIVYNKMMLYSAHLMGSVRMSADPSKGPTSPSGELYAVKNLFVGDASVFPTTPAVNPMISIMAMALRTSESILTALKTLG